VRDDVRKLALEGLAFGERRGRDESEIVTSIIADESDFELDLCSALFTAE
jgi:hypothetical protein